MIESTFMIRSPHPCCKVHDLKYSLLIWGLQPWSKVKMKLHSNLLCSTFMIRSPLPWCKVHDLMYLSTIRDLMSVISCFTFLHYLKSKLQPVWFCTSWEKEVNIFKAVVNMDLSSMDKYDLYYGQKCLLKSSSNITEDNFVIEKSTIERDANMCILESIEYGGDKEITAEYYTKRKLDQDTPFLKGWLNDFSWLYEVTILTSHHNLNLFKFRTFDHFYTIWRSFVKTIVDLRSSKLTIFRTTLNQSILTLSLYYKHS